MTIQNIQEGIVEWFRLQPGQMKTERQIDNVCRRLFDQYFPSSYSSSGIYQILHPLLRLGVIEFYGEGTYGLSPSAVFQGKTCLIWVNVAVPLARLLSEKVITTLPFGIFVTNKDKDMLPLATRYGVTLSTFSLSSCLNILPTFEKIITSWPDRVVIEDSSLLSFSPPFSWCYLAAIPERGLFKIGKEVYNTRVIRINPASWKTVPNRRQNVDAPNIAAIWAMLQQAYDLGIAYWPSQSLLKIRNLYFPIVLERLLMLNTLSHEAGKLSLLERTYYISLSDFGRFNRLFDHKIMIL